MSEIKFGNNEFYIEEAGEVIARIQFVPGEKDANGRDSLVVNHTIVNEGHNGKGLARKLVNKIAEYARLENKYIIPECSYAKKVLESNEEYHDIIAD